MNHTNYFWYDSSFPQNTFIHTRSFSTFSVAKTSLPWRTIIMRLVFLPPFRLRPGFTMSLAIHRFFYKMTPAFQIGMLFGLKWLHFTENKNDLNKRRRHNHNKSVECKVSPTLWWKWVVNFAFFPAELTYLLKNEPKEPK